MITNLGPVAYIMAYITLTLGMTARIKMVGYQRPRTYYRGETVTSGLKNT